jgi:cyclic pyranopterin phosphate synthase
MLSVLDMLHRPLRDLRISVTDRCQLRCRYCMPREVYGPGFEFLPRSDILAFEEITRLAGVFATLGVSKVRLTGGEPLLRRELPRLVGMLAGTPGIEEVALTTNGLLLARHAEALARAGLDRVTVSLDALDDEPLARIADAPVSAQRVLAGIDAALAAGLDPVKVNMVVRRGFNDDCVPALAAHFRHRPVTVRFIEYMDVGSTNGWQQNDVIPAERIVDEIDSRWALEPLDPAREGEVATRYRYRDGAGEIGVISSITKPFCSTCVRARLSADGTLFTCLFAQRGTDLRSPLRRGASDGELARLVQAVWERRVDRYSAERAHTRKRHGAKVEMSYIGG